MSHVDDMLELVYNAAEQVNETLPPSQRLVLAPATPMMGRTATLDSLHLINLLVSLSSLFRDRTGIDLPLLEDERVFDENGPLSSFGAMADFLAAKVPA